MFSTWYQQFAKVYNAWPVKAENCDGRSTNCGNAYQRSGVITPREVVVPTMGSWVVKGYAFSGNGIRTGGQ